MVLHEASNSSLLFSEAHYDSYITFSLYHEPPNCVRFIQRHVIFPILHSVAPSHQILFVCFQRHLCYCAYFTIGVEGKRI